MSFLNKYFTKVELKTFLIWIAILALMFLGMKGWLVAVNYATLSEKLKCDLQISLSTMHNYKIVNTEYTIEVWKENKLETEYPNNKKFILEFKGR